MPKITKQELIDFEADLAQHWEKGDIKCPLHLSGGNEDQLLKIFKEINTDDYIFSSHRNHYHALLHGVKPEIIKKEILKSSDAIYGGRSGSMGFISHKHKFYASAIVGGCCAIAVGVAWALKEYNKEHFFCDEDQTKLRRRVWCFVGDGVIDGGHFWEAFRYVMGYQLPLTFVVEDNDRATCTTIANRLGTMRLKESVEPYLHYYGYNPTHKHVGTNKYVQF